MKIQAFEVQFDDSTTNPQAVYRSGQTVSVKVHLKLLEPIKCRGIDVQLFGNSWVCWTETDDDKGPESTSKTNDYRSEEVYVDQLVTVFTAKAAGPDADLHPAGEFFYPVAFKLSEAAPSSFESAIGKIRYFVKATINRPWRFDKSTQRMYTVIRELDLNRESPDLTGPYETSDHLDVNCCHCYGCCCGKIQAQLSVARRGLVPGELVHVTGELRNNTTNDLDNVCLEIYQRSEFHAKNCTKAVVRVASSVQLPPVPRGRTVQVDHQLPVTPLPSSRIDGCGNIDVQYFLRLHADGGCCLSVKKACCELLIGTVPLWSVYGSREAAVTAGPPDPALAAPTSYEMCTFGQVKVDQCCCTVSADVQPTHWAPSYPVFASLPSLPSSSAAAEN